MTAEGRRERAKSAESGDVIGAEETHYDGTHSFELGNHGRGAG
jgi:hypothetical protein